MSERNHCRVCGERVGSSSFFPREVVVDVRSAAWLCSPMLCSLLFVGACSDPEIAPSDAGPLADATGADAASIATRSGSVSVAQSVADTASAHSLGGYFSEVSVEELRAGRIPGSGCAVAEESGPCQRISCSGGSVAPTHDAGELRASIAGRPLLAANLTAPPPSYGASTAGLGFSAGQLISLEATGGEVPAFSAEVTAPPLLDLALPTTASRVAPLTLSWSATTATTAQISLLGPSFGVVCRAPGGAGAITIDASLLDDFAAGSTVSLLAATSNVVEVRAGDYLVDVVVTQTISERTTLE